MRERICIPIYDGRGDLVAYAGTPDDLPDDDAEQPGIGVGDRGVGRVESGYSGVPSE